MTTTTRSTEQHATRDAPAYGVDGVQAKITPTLACNNDCRFCYNRISKSDRSVMDEQQVMNLVDSAAAAGATELNLIGGEVTLLPYFLRALERARGRFEFVSINSNGRRFADGCFARACVDAGLTSVDISLHGSDSGIHDGVTRAAGAFDEVIAGLKHLVGLANDNPGLKVSVTTVVTDWNVDDLVRVGALLRTLGITAWRLKYAIGALDDREADVDGDYIVSYGRFMPVFRRMMDEHGGSIRIAVHDVPTCVLDEYFELSCVHERHTVARYTEAGPESAEVVLGHWADSSAKCAACTARPVCGRPSPAYIAQHGDGDLRALDADSLALLRQRANAMSATIAAREASHGGHWRGPGAGRHAAHDAGFAAIDRAAREGRWQDVRSECMRVLERHPDLAEAVRMRRRAEAQLLEALATRQEARGDRAAAKRTRRLLGAYAEDRAR